ncbi:hypothetical protein BDF22DRAFT_682268 [Syncephalis plumigaleata]|nr:hypothetical protein BDF22DRAFT_682268 [Syncephalis plumigaleata]
MSFAKYKKRCWTTERTLVDRLDLLREAATTGKDTDQLEQETESLLSEYARAIDALEKALHEDERAGKGTASTIAFRTSYLQRQQDTLKETRATFTSLKTARQQAERQALIGMHPHLQSKQFSSQTDYWLDERGNIDRSNDMTDTLIQHASNVRMELEEQRNSISRSTGIVRTLTQTVPGLNAIIGRIMRRRRRDMLIMVAVISVCSILLLLYIQH